LADISLKHIKDATLPHAYHLDHGNQA
jgi:hypothetical protein